MDERLDCCGGADEHEPFCDVGVFAREKRDYARLAALESYVAEQAARPCENREVREAVVQGRRLLPDCGVCGTCKARALEGK